MKEAQVLKCLTEAHELAKNLRPLQAVMVLRAPETTEFVTRKVLFMCVRSFTQLVCVGHGAACAGDGRVRGTKKEEA